MKKEVIKKKKDAAVPAYHNATYVCAIVFREKEKNIFLVDDFLEKNSIKPVYKKISLVPLYITVKKEGGERGRSWR